MIGFLVLLIMKWIAHTKKEKATLRDMFEHLGNQEIIEAIDIATRDANRGIANNKAGDPSSDNKV